MLLRTGCLEGEARDRELTPEVGTGGRGSDRVGGGGGVGRDQGKLRGAARWSPCQGRTQVAEGNIAGGGAEGGDSVPP